MKKKSIEKNLQIFEEKGKKINKGGVINIYD